MLELEQVTIGYRQSGGWIDAVREVDLHLEPGQTYGLVGESGSGKSTLALAVMRFLPENGALREGSIRLNGEDIYAYSDSDLRRFWRERVKLVPQNPLPSLNPSHTVGRQLEEVLRPGREGERQTRRRAIELFEAVGLADPERVADSYPHQLSGGMQQRVMIAMALGGEPDLLILDEPTTNLDVTTEANILDMIGDLVRDRGTAVLYVSHSLGVVAQVCDRVAVLYAGDLVEDAAVEHLYSRPLHPYTQGLLDSVPRVGQDKRQVALRPIPGQIPDIADLPDACIFAPRCPVAIDACTDGHPDLFDAGNGRRARCIRFEEIGAGDLDPRQPGTSRSVETDTRERDPVLELRDLHKRFDVNRSVVDVITGNRAQQVRAVDGIDLEVPKRTTVGLVGESGSGKSTLARAVIGLESATSGQMELLEMPLARDLRDRDQEVLKRLQMVFQSSDEALNPYRTVGQALRRPFMRLGGFDRDEADDRARALLSQVRLNPDYMHRRPDQLSGGEKQRVAIARAFASQPDLLLFDESVSGLDVSVQAAILNLLDDLQGEHETAYLFISHDLAVVSYLADAIAVVYLGHLMEVGPTAAVLEPPYHPYTEALLSAIPLIDPDARRATIRLEGDVPSPVDIPSGCRFHTRCPRYIGDICREEDPPWREDERGVRIYCHIPLDELEDAQERVFRFSTDEPSGDRRPADEATESTGAEEGSPRG